MTEEKTIESPGVEDKNAMFCSHVPGVFPHALRLPFVEGMPNAQKVKELNSWIRKNSDRYLGKNVVLYHATDIRLPIRDEGLKPTSATRRRSYQSTPGFVYLAATPDRAQAFGDLGNQGASRVYAVSVSIRSLKADLDQLTNARSVGEVVGNSVAESILYGGGARVKGGISCWDIQEVHRGEQGNFVLGSNPKWDARMLEEARYRHDRALEFINSTSLPAAKKGCRSLDVVIA